MATTILPRMKSSAEFGKRLVKEFTSLPNPRNETEKRTEEAGRRVDEIVVPFWRKLMEKELKKRERLRKKRLKLEDEKRRTKKYRNSMGERL